MKKIIKEMIGLVAGILTVPSLKKEKTKNSKRTKGKSNSKKQAKIKKAFTEIDGLWKDLALKEWAGWQAFARRWRRTHKRKADGRPWRGKHHFIGTSAFKMINLLLANIDMPYIRKAPVGISPPSMAGDLIVEYKAEEGFSYSDGNLRVSATAKSTKGYFDIKWSDPLYTAGKTFVRLWVQSAYRGSKGATPIIQSIVPCGTEHCSLEGFLYKDKLLPITKGMWLFYLDAVSEYGLRSATSEVVRIKT